MQFANAVQQWFDAEQGGSLILPDGWYGRPFDNHHALTSLVESELALTLVLDRKLTLRFVGLKSVEAKKGQLSLGSFEKLYFDWESFGADEKRGTKEYETGEVKIVSAP